MLLCFILLWIECEGMLLSDYNSQCHQYNIESSDCVFLYGQFEPGNKPFIAHCKPFTVPCQPFIAPCKPFIVLCRLFIVPCKPSIILCRVRFVRCKWCSSIFQGLLCIPIFTRNSGRTFPGILYTSDFIS